MAWYDWLVVIVPILIVLGVGLYSSKYVKGVVDFLSAGRLCGRYVLLAGDMANGISILGIVAYCEQHYSAGYATALWNLVMIPITLTLALFGFVVYRFRETKAQSFGQFIELRYGSKSLRIFASTLRTFAEVLAHSIMPAVAGRFFLYYFGFPQYIDICGIHVSVFVLIMSVCMFMALFIICCGGTLSVVVTDSIQGMICLPLMVLFTIFLLWKFNWGTEIMPVLADRAPGQSFMNPYDVLRLRDFNLTLLLMGGLTTFIHGASWIGGGSTGAATSPHEQKMASIMGRWRGFFTPLLYLLISLSVLVLLNHEHFSKEARQIRCDLSAQVACDVVRDNAVLQETLMTNINAIPEQKHKIGVDAPLSHEKNLETVYIDTARRTFEEAGLENSAYLTQQFTTIYHQTMMSVTIRKLFAPGMMGLFCLLTILAMLSTDTSFIFNSVITIVQDMILPFFKNAPSPKLHIWLFRIVAILIGSMSIVISTFMAQLDYLQLFITIILSMWMGGCGPVCTFALYGRFGTKHGAWGSLISGFFLSLGGFFCQRRWADLIYPFLEEKGWVEITAKIFEKASAPMNPLIVWKMNPEKFPINSFEIYFMTMLITLAIYIIVSKLTCKGPFNLERMLHRGIYNEDGTKPAKTDWHFKNILRIMSGITPQHTRGDRAISYSLVIYTYIYKFMGCFLVVVIWNAISPWPIQWWGNYFYIVHIFVPMIAVAITSVWFGIGGFFGIGQLFRNLRKRGEVDLLDNGMVENGVSLADEAKFKAIEAQAREAATEKEKS